MAPERDPESVQLEVDYWRALLPDLRAINDGILAASHAVAGIPIELLPLLFVAEAGDVADRVSRHVHRGQTAIADMQEPLDRILELLQGRLVALRAEAGLPPAVTP